MYSLILQGSLNAPATSGQAAFGGEMITLWYSCCKSEAVWRSAMPAAVLRGKRPDEIVQKLQGATGATNEPLFSGKGIRAVVFTENTPCFIFSTALSPTRSVCFLRSSLR